MTSLPSSPFLRKPLQSLAQAHHAARIGNLRRTLAKERLCIQDVTASMKDCCSVAHYDEYLPRAYIIREMFKCLRNNLTIAKGNWEKALGWTMSDAEWEREHQEDECWQDAAEERRHQAGARQRVI